MENIEKEINELIGKDEAKAKVIAEKLVNTADIELFKGLVYKTDFLFDFVKNNVAKRIENAVTKSNFKNIIKMFEVYSPDYDDLFAGILAKHASQDLTDEIFEKYADVVFDEAENRMHSIKAIIAATIR